MYTTLLNRVICIANPYMYSRNVSEENLCRATHSYASRFWNKRAKPRSNDKTYDTHCEYTCTLYTHIQQRLSVLHMQCHIFSNCTTMYRFGIASSTMLFLYLSVVLSFCSEYINMIIPFSQPHYNISSSMHHLWSSTAWSSLWLSLSLSPKRYIRQCSIYVLTMSYANLISKINPRYGLCRDSNSNFYCLS